MTAKLGVRRGATRHQPELTRSGERLLTALAENARRGGWQTLALTVSPRNPAGGLYRRLGYEAVGRTDRGLLVMRLQL
ncbi:MAG: GNAT family N-acetyltransferase [Chloroflexota bacterium]|nr:GNAT family N-acetyltransferase [Chloroflexota bacterium]